MPPIPYKCHLEEVAFVGDSLKICPQFESRVEHPGAICVYRSRKPKTGNSDSHGPRPVHLITTMIKWIRTCRFSMKNSLSVSKTSAPVHEIWNIVEIGLA